MTGREGEQHELYYEQCGAAMVVKQPIQEIAGVPYTRCYDDHAQFSIYDPVDEDRDVYSTTPRKEMSSISFVTAHECLTRHCGPRPTRPDLTIRSDGAA